MVSSILFLSSCNEPTKKRKIKTFPWSGARQEAFVDQGIECIPLAVIKF